MPPLPEQTLLHASFDDGTFANGLLHEEGIRLVEGWSGYAAEVGPESYISWGVTTPSGDLAGPPGQGIIRFWYCPSTSAASSSSSLASSSLASSSAGEAVLVDLVVLTGRALPWMTLRVTPDAIGLTAGNNIILGAAKDWQPGTWHLIAISYSSQATVLYLDGKPAASGAGVAAPRLVAGGKFGLSMGSAFDGTQQAQGDYDEMTVLPEMDIPLASYYQWLAPIAALGPVTPAEIAAEAQAEEEAELQAQSQALASRLMSPMSPMGGPLAPSSNDLTNGPLRIASIAWAATNGTGFSNMVTMQLACSNYTQQFDVFRTRALANNPLTNCYWAWVARDFPGNTITLTNEPFPTAFYLAAYTNDSDGDGLSDAYEVLVSRSNPGVPPSVSLTSPTNGATFASPATITLSATVSNAIPPATVTFYANGQPVGSSGDPYSTGITELPCGNYSLQAFIQDAAGAWATSAVISVTVTLPQPASIRIWLKADAMALTNGSLVSQWTDSSGNANNATSSGTSRPTFLTNQVNGLPAIFFDGTNDYMNLPNCLQGLSVAEAFVVLRPSPSTLSGPLWAFTANNQYTSYNTNGINDAFGRGDVLHFGPNPVLSSFHVYNVYADPSTWWARLNGELVESTYNFSTSFNFSTAPTLGRCYNGTQWMYGKPVIAEIIIYTNALTDAERFSVGRYLNDKYNLGVSPPGVPAGLRCTGVDASTISLSWNALTNADGCTLKRKVGGGDWSAIATLDPATQAFTDSISSGESIQYGLYAYTYGGSTCATLDTPIVVVTSPPSGACSTGQDVAVAMAQQGGNPLTKIEIFRDSRLISVQSPSPLSPPNYGITLNSASPTCWAITIKATDTSGNSRWSPVFTLTALASTDMDGDGVPDANDAFPWDPLRWQMPPPVPGDTNAPVITITEP